MVKLHYNGCPKSLIIKTFLKPLITLEGCKNAGFLNHSTADISDLIIFAVAVVLLCIAGHLAVSLASTH